MNPDNQLVDVMTMVRVMDRDLRFHQELDRTNSAVDDLRRCLARIDDVLAQRDEHIDDLEQHVEGLDHQIYLLQRRVAALEAGGRWVG